MTVKNIFDILNELFPCRTACDFDNVGLLIGDLDARVTKALIALDCTEAALKKASENGCELIITHHPVIFSPLKSITADDYRYSLIKSGIAVISMHTNMDIAENGVSAILADALELSETEPYRTDDGFVLRLGKNPKPMSADEMALKIRQKLGGAVKYSDSGKLIDRILVCSGSGGEFIAAAAEAGAQALVTSEIKHHSFYEAVRLGISVFDAGHFNTEDIAVEPLKKLLQGRLPEVKFITDHSTVIKCL